MTDNRAWRLEDFVDSLVVELDKTRQTLAVKAINTQLSYSVKEVSLDVNAFPTYTDGSVRFTTAQPGEEGASKLSIQLNSITDQQVRATTRLKSVEAGTSLDEVEVDAGTRQKLRRIGVNSVDDLQELQARNVDLGAATDSDIDYGQLARKIQKARRGRSGPAIDAVSLTREDEPVLLIEGSQLAIDPTFEPVAVLNGELAEVLSHGPAHVSVAVPAGRSLAAENEVVITFDPYAVVRVNVRT
ncbi:hypothetical protein AB0K08_02245 [Citricoccus sp. NPDC055426]|uniref:hypothetical protein n=1 Tax=Citricoccus sp. NPDC055426 TaxID=3155536 RepID=UPI0034133BFF